MIHLEDEICGEPINFYVAETPRDAKRIYDASLDRRVWALDTESTGLNCYSPSWELRTFQFGNSRASFVLPARFRNTIRRIITRKGVDWIGHNGAHDIRCIDTFLNCETGVRVSGETYIPGHHRDSRNRSEGGVGHALKELAIAFVDRAAGKWEQALKDKFKTILIPIPGEVYKSGARKGTQKFRKAKLAEGWGLIDPMDPTYLAYAASDTVLTFRVWQKLRSVAQSSRELYEFDRSVALACDRLQRRAIRLDVPYTERLSLAYTRESERQIDIALEYGCQNIHSGQQIAKTLLALGVQLSKTTPTGQWVTDGEVLRGLLSHPDAGRFVRAVLLARQCIKRRESYTDQMLREMDAGGRVHPSINSLAARTARMSVSNPPLQQLPTKDRENELGEWIDAN